MSDMIPPFLDGAARPDGFLRVSAALRALAHEHEPRWLDTSARSSQEAADALGVALGRSQERGLPAQIGRRGRAGDRVRRQARRRAQARGAYRQAGPRGCGLREGAHRLLDRRRVAAGLRAEPGQTARASRRCSSSTRSCSAST
ncbi:hypothetical protein Ddc_24829 [Ditylenchus destructor]|nr:hypothetical protein Ddc_24829 [Ditylenchus destructor]